MRRLQLAVDVVETRQALLQRGAPKDAEDARAEIAAVWLSRLHRHFGRVHLLVTAGLGRVLKRVNHPTNPRTRGRAPPRISRAVLHDLNERIPNYESEGHDPG